MPSVEENAGLTPLGKLISVVLIVGLLGTGVYVLTREPKPVPPPPHGGVGPPSAVPVPQAAPVGPAANPAALQCEMRTEVPRLDPPGVYQVKNNIVEVELSEYAGYAGLIAANGGREPNENSIFFKKHGFKVSFKLSEEESWSALNSGKMAASATTADVLAVYGRQFQVLVPAQIGFSRGADGVVVNADLKRINALKGRTLTASQFTESDFFIRYLAQEAGLGVQMLQDLNATPDAAKINLVYCKDAFAAGDCYLEELKGGRSRLAGCVTWDPKTTEVVEQSGGKARILTTNRNLLIVADVLIVNRGFAQQHPEKVAGLVNGLLEGNRMVREHMDAHLEVVAAAFKWDRAKTRAELQKVHLANLPENLAFFSGAIDAAGSFGSIYQYALLAYGNLIKEPVDGERFIELRHLKALEESGAFKDQKIAIAPVRSAATGNVEHNPLLNKDIRFLFEPNSAVLDLQNESNHKHNESIKKLLQISPGSTILLRGHVDASQVDEFRKKGGEGFVRQMALKSMALSTDRAREIKRQLVAKHGVDPARVETLGRGWEEPASPNADENRRVEVQWFTLE